MMSGAPTGRVTAWVLPARTAISVAGWCAASEQPPHESVKNALSDHLLSRVRPRYVRARRRTRHFCRVAGLARGSGLAGGRDRRPTAPGLTGLPEAVHRQLGRAARAADDQRRRRDPGVRTDGVVVLRRPGRGLRAGTPGHARAVRRRHRGRRRPSHPGAGLERRALGGLHRARRPGLRRRGLGVAALRLHRRAVGVLRGQQPGSQRDAASAPRQGAPPGGIGAEHGVAQPGLHLRPDARRPRDQVAGLRRGVHGRRDHVLGRLLRARQAAPDATDGRQPARRTAVGRRRPAVPPALAEPADDVRPRPVRDGARPAAGAVPGARLQGVRRRRRRRGPAAVGACRSERSSPSCSRDGSAGSACRAWRS